MPYHSHAPWRQDGNKIQCASGYNMATINSHRTTEGEANARLIAAAPDLLEALEWMVRWAERHNLDTAELITGERAELPVIATARPVIATARAAINKARG